MTLHASLPMYDRPEMRDATDGFWTLIRDALRDHGVAAPEALKRDEPKLWAMWTSPDLLFSQTCGLPVRTTLHDKVQLIFTPDTGLPGCPPGHYNSVLLTRPELAERPVDALLSLRLAINEPESQSGWGSINRYARDRGVAINRPRISGAHAESVRLLLAGEVDLAAVDAHTWRLLQRYEPTVAHLVERDRTRPTPATPYITGMAQDPALLRAAVEQGFAALPEAHKETLGIRGFARINLGAYMALPIPPSPGDLPV
ncbi:phosphate/phosphite/phosphonate ABC transporter substrate-binding protein [Nioella nitratireducens]|uniref:phosphate/phosphite/phosphonate ABC transporter substrate-binding protein n=1 Tax=Nioella nitratireducens TaxID=1287720 RepID=UPI001F4832F8|nr:phosphate/phosphite/phosphonate ABC transporter substrate-binding protein [Nioella nitratireducens]